MNEAYRSLEQSLRTPQAAVTAPENIQLIATQLHDQLGSSSPTELNLLDIRGNLSRRIQHLYQLNIPTPATEVRTERGVLFDLYTAPHAIPGRKARLLLLQPQTQEDADAMQALDVPTGWQLIDSPLNPKPLPNRFQFALGGYTFHNLRGSRVLQERPATLYQFEQTGIEILIAVRRLPAEQQLEGLQGEYREMRVPLGTTDISAQMTNLETVKV